MLKLCTLNIVCYNCMLKMRICGYYVFLITKKKRTKMDENVFRIFQPLHIIIWSTFFISACILADRLQKLKPDQISTRHQIIKMLLMHDANPSAFNSEGKTPDQLLPHSTVSNTVMRYANKYSSLQYNRFVVHFGQNTKMPLFYNHKN